MHSKTNIEKKIHLLQYTLVINVVKNIIYYILVQIKAYIKKKLLNIFFLLYDIFLKNIKSLS